MCPQDLIDLSGYHESFIPELVLIPREVLSQSNMTGTFLCSFLHGAVNEDKIKHSQIL